MSIAGKIETAANVATILVAVLISTVLAKTFVLPSTVARRTTIVSASEIVKGKSVDARF